MEVKEISEGTAVVSLQGAIDISNALEIKEKLESLINQGRVNIVINLPGVTYIDSSGLGAIISNFKKAEENKGALRFAEVSPIVIDVFNTTGLNKVFEIYNSINEALASYE